VRTTSTYCDGVGTCEPTNDDADAATGCVFTGNPCSGVTPVCVEASDTCEACGDDADCDDDVPCTDDSCDTGTGECTNDLNDDNCPDALFCDGADLCDPTNADADADGCYAPGPACTGTEPVCDEDADTCAACEANSDCDDDIACTEDTCNGTTGECTNTADDSLCPDPDFCDGTDVCDPTNDDADSSGCVPDAATEPCTATTPVCDEVEETCAECDGDASCTDGYSCTDDNCEGDGSCTSTNNDDNCDDGDVCDPTDADADATTGCYTP